MLANRISYWIDGKGPSFCVDYGCAGSSACLEMAYRAIKSGDCDAAIVGGCNYTTHPCITLNMRKFVFILRHLYSLTCTINSSFNNVI